MLKKENIWKTENKPFKKDAHVNFETCFFSTHFVWTYLEETFCNG